MISMPLTPHGGAPQLVEHAADSRREVEEYIRRSFHVAHGASLRHLMPRLFTLRSAGGATLGAFGLREAAAERLFMETYIDEPVEQAIAGHARRPVDRAGIVEVGNLAVSGPGGARQVIATLTRHLHRTGFEWVVFTGVAALRSAFFRLGLSPFFLAAADPARLAPEELAAWGRYFAAQPMVMGGHVTSGFRSLPTGPQA